MPAEINNQPNNGNDYRAQPYQRENVHSVPILDKRSVRQLAEESDVVFTFGTGIGCIGNSCRKQTWVLKKSLRLAGEIQGKHVRRRNPSHCFAGFLFSEGC